MRSRRKLVSINGVGWYDLRMEMVEKDKTEDRPRLVDFLQMEVERLKREVQRQKDHNTLVTSSLRQERDRRKQFGESLLQLSRKLRTLVKEVERGSDGPRLREVVSEIDPDRSIRMGLTGA
jgi:hypothetical protein